MIEAPRHGLDEAIDRVAAKLVAVTDDVGLLQQVMARLPERESPSWFLALPVQLAAGAALLLLAFLWARPVEKPMSPSVSADARIHSATRLEEAGPPHLEPLVADARIPNPGSRLRRGFGGQARIPVVALDRPDHEHSLAPVAPPVALELTSIAPWALEPHAAVVLAPLVLTELAPANEPDSPRQR